MQTPTNYVKNTCKKRCDGCHQQPYNAKRGPAVFNREIEFCVYSCAHTRIFEELTNLLSHVKHPHHYISLNNNSRSDLNLCSYASKATFGLKWIQMQFPTTWIVQEIAVLELYLIYVMVAMFGLSITKSTILCLCDSIAIVNIINKQSTKPGNNGSC